MDRAEFQRLFADLNEKHLASGLSPNEACARALVEANKLAKGVVPGQSGSGASSLRVTKDEEDAASQPKSKAGGGSSRNEAASDSSAMRDDGPGLSLAILRPLAEEAAREGGSKSACVRVVGRVFGDLEALGQSFLLSEKEQRQSSALDSSGLDLDAVVEAYTLISSAKLTEVLAGAMERLVTPGSLLSLRSSVQSKSTAGMSKQPGKAPTNGKRKRGKADAIDEGQDNKSGESGSGSGSSSADSMGSSGISTGAVSPYLDLAEDEAAQVGPRLRVLQILLLAPLLEDPDYHEKLVLPICDCINSLPLPAKLALVSWMSCYSVDHFSTVLGAMQQFVTVTIFMSTRENGHYTLRATGAATRFMALMYAANEISGQRDAARRLKLTLSLSAAARSAQAGDGSEHAMEMSSESEAEGAGEGSGKTAAAEASSSSSSSSSASVSVSAGPSSTASSLGLGIGKTIVPFSEFYNETVNEHIDMDSDFVRWTRRIKQVAAQRRQQKRRAAERQRAAQQVLDVFTSPEALSIAGATTGGGGGGGEGTGDGGTAAERSGGSDSSSGAAGAASTSGASGVAGASSGASVMDVDGGEQAQGQEQERNHTDSSTVAASGASIAAATASGQSSSSSTASSRSNARSRGNYFAGEPRQITSRLMRLSSLLSADDASTGPAGAATSEEDEDGSGGGGGSGGRRAPLFSFCEFPFVFDPASKARLLRTASRMAMRDQMQSTIISSFLQQARAIPYFVLRVRRTHVVEDALQAISSRPAEELQKPLKVKFVGEDGVDEGGVQKEFFQILTRELFDPQFGMFKMDEETRVFWFNPDSFEPNIKFELVGVLLGLAIYNSIVLDVHFPMVVYRKLLGGEPTLADVKGVDLAIYTSMLQLLHTEDASVAGLDFEVAYETSFGERKTVELVPGGANVDVTNENRVDFVRRYVKWFLSGKVARQYDAFERGFRKLCGLSKEEDAMNLFRAEEIELLICGSPELDFHALEEAAAYDDGFSEESTVIKDFWSIVHEMSEENKRKLLAFSTGSARAPIKGLGALRLTITRMGPDSAQLPTAHTCFNHLLLPEYSSRDKLKRLLLRAISESEGFGLI